MPFVEPPITVFIRKLAKLKSSFVRKLSKARLKCITVTVQSKTELSEVWKLSKVRLELLVKLFQKSCLNGSILKVPRFPRLFLCKYSKELYFWTTTFEIYYIFLGFFFNRSSRLRCSVKILLRNIRTLVLEDNCPLVRVRVCFRVRNRIRVGGAIFLGGICPRTLYNKLFLFWRCSAKGVALWLHMVAFAKGSSNSCIAWYAFRYINNEFNILFD